MEEKIIQITSGKGPEECERVVYRIWTEMKKEILKRELTFELIEFIEGKYDNCYLSVLIKLKGDNLATFCKDWQGTIQWIGQSPYRKFHKRKNWFVGVVVHDIPKAIPWQEKDVSYQTLRASGPGGQHVNKVESAVRATHIPSGVSVTASSERSQLMNKKEATERLKNKLLSQQIEEANKNVQEQWMEHNTLERGNAVKVFRGEL